MNNQLTTIYYFVVIVDKCSNCNIFFWIQSGSVVGRNQFRRTRSYNSGKPFEVRQPKLVSYVHLKVHKIENFFGSDFELCVISLLLVSYAQILRFCKKPFLIRPLLGEIQLFRVV